MSTRDAEVTRLLRRSRLARKRAERYSMSSVAVGLVGALSGAASIILLDGDAESLWWLFAFLWGFACLALSGALEGRASSFRRRSTYALDAALWLNSLEEPHD